MEPLGKEPLQKAFGTPESGAKPFRSLVPNPPGTYYGGY